MDKREEILIGATCRGGMSRADIVYISGAITNDPNYKEKFSKAEKQLQDLGYIVLNPTVIPPLLTHEEHMHIDLAMIDVSNALCMLPDWKESEGAKIEFRNGFELCKKILYYGDFINEKNSEI